MQRHTEQRTEQPTEQPHGQAVEFASCVPVEAPESPSEMRRIVRSPALSIDCGDCVMAGTSACDDCIVSFVVNREPGDAVVIDVEEHRAVRLLQSAGLVPDSRHRSRAG
jgi:hypothetical protein